MSLRRPVVPPPPPDVPLPVVSPALSRGPGGSGVGSRLRVWRALAGCTLLLGAVPWAAWHLVAAGAPAADVLWWAGCVGAVAGVGVVWVGLSFAQDLAQLTHTIALWKVQLGGLSAGLRVGRESRAAWDRRWGRKPPPAPAAAPVIHHWSGTAAPAARVVPPDPGTTRRLPALPPGDPPAPYAGTAEQAIVAALAVGARVSERQRPAGLTKPAYLAAVARLRAAGVLVVPGRGQGVALAPAFARLAPAPALLDTEVGRALGAPEGA